MTPGLFADHGYRFRKNRFKNALSIWPSGSDIDDFYDITLYSSDYLTVGKDYSMIAEMYFRMSTDSLEHKRVVYKFMDWLGALGGVEKILMKIILLVTGGFTSFNSNINTSNINNTINRKR